MGYWISASGNVEVEIAPCDSNASDARPRGKITRILANRSMSESGEAMSMTGFDDTGPRILTDFAPAGGDTFQGHLLNRENGKIYDCIPRPGSADEMIVHPYVLMALFGSTRIWHRPP
jgi:uncharacterized protein (DUF2147 family)